MYASLGCASSIGDSLTRWIGFEDTGELIADLDQALAVIS
jgi:cystathionine beta-lyase/cystathionine gamma-synthase